MSEKTQMKADMVRNLACLLMENHPDMTMEQALSAVFNSDTYQKVMDEGTGLYYQSPRYVFAFLKEELVKGKFE